MSVILKVFGREILDSRGSPTVEAEVHLKGGIVSCASVPSGASTGCNEALELRDKDKSRFFGKGVIKSVGFINGIISSALIGLNPIEQEVIDNIMINLDGTENKSKLGANTILSVSLAVAKAAACIKKIPLYRYIAELLNDTSNIFLMPIPMMNIVNGGIHADNNLDIQEFMIQPIGADSFKEAVRMGAEIFYELGNVLKSRDINMSIGDEGGYAPNLSSSVSVFEFIHEATEKAGYLLGKDITLAIDCASSELFDNSGCYILKGEDRVFNSKEFTHYLKSLSDAYPILSIEDGASESDWEGFLYQTNLLGSKVQLVGDDLFVTNIKMLQKGIEHGVANAILIKLNQIGTLTETLSAIRIAKRAGYNVIISHRSGETEDAFIADLAVGTAAGQIKTGSLRGSDRLAKYNQLMRIESDLGNKVIYNSEKEFRRFR